MLLHIVVFGQIWLQRQVLLIKGAYTDIYIYTQTIPRTVCLGADPHQQEDGFATWNVHTS